jgi:hypothetical protein
MAEPDRIDEILADDKFIDDLVEGGVLPDDWNKL